VNISDEILELAARAAAKAEDASNWDDEPEYYRSGWINRIAPALAAAAPILLSHERQQTADAHRDAIVNRDTADRLERELEAAKADAWDEALTEAAGLYMDRSSADYMKETNPYRSQA
jgi:hypothetical protein